MLKDTISTYYSNGKIAENNFASDLVRSEGGVVLPPTREDDIVNHIDLYWSYNGKYCSFDVKGARKKSRYDNSVDYDKTWLEFKNVHGNDGSLFGKQNYIAFEAEKQWVIVRRKEILKAIIDKIVDKTIYSKNPNEDYKLYQRSGRQDLIVRVPFSFITQNAVKYIDKTLD